MNIDSITGHLATCDFHTHINRPVNGVKPHCCHVNYWLDEQTGRQEYCGTVLSKQACLLEGMGWCTGKIDHWGQECEWQGWEKHLSRCANIICDWLGIPSVAPDGIFDRSDINQYNIEEVLGIPADPMYNHISDARRRVNDDDTEDTDDEDYEDTDNDDDNDDLVPRTNRTRSSDVRKHNQITFKRPRSFDHDEESYCPKKHCSSNLRNK